MNKQQTNNEALEAKQEKHKPAISSWTIRAALGIIWFCMYVSIIWFAESRTTFGNIIGFSALATGAAAVLLPKSVLGEKKWNYTVYAFFALCALFLIKR